MALHAAALLFGTRVAETILASVHVRAHPQAGHMDASNLIKALQNTLRGGGRPHMGLGQHALNIYRQRWKIETLFAALKTRGFNLEATHMTDPAKLSTLIAILAMAASVAYKTSLWAFGGQSSRCKAHGRPARSLFALGLDGL